MAFTNVFDNGFPLDTQQAKLLGDDIRKMKVDLQERMAAISGLDAAKPDLGADTQPAKWNGMLFFATDSGKIYQFVNPNWNFLGSVFSSNLKKYSVVGGTTSADGESLATITIPSGVLAVNSLIRIYSVTYVTTAILSLIVDGQTGFPFAWPAASVPLFDSVSVFVKSLTTVDVVDSKLVNAPHTFTVSDITTNDLVLDFQQTGAGSGINDFIVAVVFA